MRRKATTNDQARGIYKKLEDSNTKDKEMLDSDVENRVSLICDEYDVLVDEYEKKPVGSITTNENDDD